MNLSEYLSTGGALTVGELRQAIGARSDAQIRQWQHGYAGRLPSPANCVAIERATGGAVTRQDLRPDDYWLIWPDLPAPTEKACAEAGREVADA
jgi:DNA-binding transcriptional regulator YdaS (Cro superfamily)